MNHRARLRKDEVNRAEKCCYICSKSALTSGCTKVVKEWLPFILLKESMCRLSGLRLCSAVSFHFSDFFFTFSFAVSVVLIAALQSCSCTASAAVCNRTVQHCTNTTATNVTWFYSTKHQDLSWLGCRCTRSYTVNAVQEQYAHSVGFNFNVVNTSSLLL